MQELSHSVEILCFLLILQHQNAQKLLYHLLVQVTAPALYQRDHIFFIELVHIDKVGKNHASVGFIGRLDLIFLGSLVGTVLVALFHLGTISEQTGTIIYWVGPVTLRLSALFLSLLLQIGLLLAIKLIEGLLLGLI